MKKKILHLFRIEKFTEGFIELMNNELNAEHIFWVYGDFNIYAQCKSSYLQEKNVKYYPRIDIKLNKNSTEVQLHKFDLIIYHGIFEDVILDYFFKYRVFLKKLVLYFWGGDKWLSGNWNNKMKKKYVIKNALSIVTIIPQDYLDIKKIYRPRGNNFCAKYFDMSSSVILDNLCKVPQKKNNVINIQIGNSATETNNHLETLKILKKFKDKNIKIYLPMSYGDMEYAKKVIEYGEDLFGDKLVAIKEFMSFEKYCLFIQEMDIAIFNMIRQQALGNIYILMQIGSKVFLNSEGLLWDYFVKDLKCEVSKVNEISRSSFEEFIEFSEREKQNNRDLIHKNFSKENSIMQWEKIFNTL